MAVIYYPDLGAWLTINGHKYIRMTGKLSTAEPVLLNGVRPSSASSWWQVETDWFRETVMGRNWVGVIQKVEREQQHQTVLVMKLFDTSCDEDFDVSEAMKSLGLAMSNTELNII